MYILAFFLLIISITKLLILGSLTWSSVKILMPDFPYRQIKLVLCIILGDALIGLICSLFILL